METVAMSWIFYKKVLLISLGIRIISKTTKKIMINRRNKRSLPKV